jgi:aspartyl-tRNA synthetase
MQYLYRSHYCEEVGLEHVGQEVRLAGWLHAIRSLPTSPVFFLLNNPRPLLLLKSSIKEISKLLPHILAIELRTRLK